MSHRTTLDAGLVTGLLLLAGCAGRAGRPPVELAGYAPATAAGLAAAGWRTDFSRREIALELIRTCGLPRDAIAPVRAPAHAAAAELDLDPAEPVLVARGRTEVRGWPLVRLLRRELALDEVDGVPVAVTFCSLCGTARVWDRRLDGRTLDFGVSGMLEDGNSLLWDRGTESLWRQIDGRAVVGELAGRRLAAVPALVLSFGELRRARPDALVMQAPAPAPDPPFRILTGVDVASGVPPAWLTVACPRPLEPALAVEDGGLLPSAGPAVEQRGAIVVFRDPSAAAAFRTADGGPSPPSGSALAFARELDGRALTFESRGGGIFDRETGTRWNLLGEAVEGPLAGRALRVAEQGGGFRFALTGDSSSIDSP